MRQKAPDRNRWPIALSVLLVGIVVAMALVAALAPALLPAADQSAWKARKS